MSKPADIKKQVEYYLSDKNLKQDKFFNDKIKENKEGWLDLNHVMLCNKLKTMKVKDSEVVEALKDSTEVEVSADHKKIRRVGGKAVPELEKKDKADGQRKRDAKATTKEEDKKSEEEEVIELDEKGNHILVNPDFENPMIIHFKTEGKEGDSFKVNWKEVENVIKKDFPKLKLVYSRADQFEGDLAISSHKLKSADVDKLTSSTAKVQDRVFTFSKTTGEELKDFWLKQGGHYQFCIQPKLRNIKKQQKINKQQKTERGDKRSKLSYEIAGVYYSDINKVKSKTRAILNLKKDGEKLSGNDEEFIKELLNFHERGSDKLKDFDHFEVGEHPDHPKTRCFFVGRKDGSKEDFSISKCIQNLEKQT